MATTTQQLSQEFATNAVAALKKAMETETDPLTAVGNVVDQWTEKAWATGWTADQVLQMQVDATRMFQNALWMVVGD